MYQTRWKNLLLCIRYENGWDIISAICVRLSVCHTTMSSLLVEYCSGFTKLGTIMSSSSLIMVHVAACLQELLPIVHEKTPFLIESDSLSLTRFNP